MKNFPALVLISGALALTACTTPNVTSSEFAAPNADDNTLIGYDNFDSAKTGDEWGFAYAAGEYVDNSGVTGIRGVSGIISTTTVTDYTTGTASYLGKFNAVHVTNIQSNGNSVTGVYNWPSEVIVLDANFDTGTLTGAAGELVVFGTFSDKNLGGSVTYNGIIGDLDGLIGADVVDGAFHGSDADEVFAGGFWGVRD